MMKRGDQGPRPLPNAKLDPALVDLAVGEHRRRLPALDRFWAYYRNPTRPAAEPGQVGRSRLLAQADGLPERLTKPGSQSPREVVIENDIAWRIHTMIDFLFGKPIKLVAEHGDEATRGAVDEALERVWDGSGGLDLLQDAALFGHVFGHVDFLVRVDEAALTRAASGPEADRLERAADAVRIEIIEPRRGAALIDDADYRRLVGYAIDFERVTNRVDRGGWSRWGERETSRAKGQMREVFGVSGWDRFEDGQRVAGGRYRFLSGVPVVHVQNVSQPLRYEGLGEVEPLIPLQDELNTRLSDRANRVTLQSFQMYLARGFEGLDATQIGPGRVFVVDDPSARIDAFGGDAPVPSEEQHVNEIRVAIDKVSGVPPIAAGSVEARIGNLSSASALRVTMVGLLAKTDRKRATYGRGIRRVCEIVLEAFDAAGVLATTRRERRVGIEWGEPLPIDDRDQLALARGKLDLGVPLERVQEELGYVPRPGPVSGGGAHAPEEPTQEQGE
ncbi:MAG: phage portal protein [Planctomycetota bacterium]